MKESARQAINLLASKYSRIEDRQAIAKWVEIHPSIATTAVWTFEKIRKGQYRNPTDDSAPWSGQWK